MQIRKRKIRYIHLLKIKKSFPVEIKKKIKKSEKASPKLQKDGWHWLFKYLILHSLKDKKNCFQLFCGLLFGGCFYNKSQHVCSIIFLNNRILVPWSVVSWSSSSLWFYSFPSLLSDNWWVIHSVLLIEFVCYKRINLTTTEIISCQKTKIVFAANQMVTHSQRHESIYTCVYVCVKIYKPVNM